MIGERIGRYRDRIRRELTAAFQEEHTPHQVGSSFAIGVFVTSLPTGGLGVGLFFLFAAWWSWISKPAIFASVAVLNPFVKPAVYVASYQTGAVLLGTRPLLSSETTVTESAGMAVQQLIVGNLLIASCLSLVSYALVSHLARVNRRRKRQSGRSLVSAVLAPFRRQ